MIYTNFKLRITAITIKSLIKNNIITKMKIKMINVQINMFINKIKIKKKEEDL